nr:small subunit ribosomal protein S3 [uncultured archaeon]
MEERKLVKLKKEEFAIREDVKRTLGKGKISKVKIEYTPIGEKIIISTHKPGLVIGRKGEKIIELTEILVPSSRAKPWRFAQGYLKKVGDTAKVVDKAQAIAQTKPGVVGVKVSILSPKIKMIDDMRIDSEAIEKIKNNEINIIEEDKKPIKKVKKIKVK